MKKNLVQATLSTFIFLLVPSLSLAQWIQTAGPYAGHVYAFASASDGTGGSYLFAGTDGGVFLTTDNGTRWTAKSSNLSNTSIRALALSPNGKKLFAGTWGGGVLLSTDNGMSWETVKTGLTNTYITALVVYADGSGDTDVIAGTNGGGMFRSTDNGASWGSVKVNPPTIGSPSVFNVFAVSDTNVFVGTDDGVFLSTDGGATWNPMDANLGYVPEVHVYSLAASSNGSGDADIFAGTAGGVFISSDNGAYWNAVNSILAVEMAPDTITVLAASPNDSGGTDVLAAARSHGVFLSTDNGSTWSTVTALKNTSVLSIAGFSPASGGTDLIAGTVSDGIFLSSDNGSSWGTINTGLETSDEALYVLPNSWGGTNIVAGTQSGIYLSTDNGGSWKEVGPASTSITSFVSSPNGSIGTNLFAGTDAGVFISTDFGATWTAVNAGLANKNVVSLAVDTSPGGITNLFAGTYGSGIYLSTNNGQSWKAVNTGFPGFIIVWSLAVFPNGTVVPEVFAGTTSGLYVSTDNGSNWKSASTTLATHDILSVFVSAEGARGTNILAGADTGVFVSTNGGATWKSTGLTDWVRSFATFRNGTNSTNLFAGSGAGLYLSSDNGVTWGAGMAVAGNGVSSLAIYPNDTNGNEILAGTPFSGVFEMPLSQIVTTVAARFSATSVDFGNAKNNQVKDTTIVISNNSFQTLQISSITSSNASFSASPTVKSVAPGQAFADTLRFAPADTGNSSGKLLVVSNAISSPDTIFVSGNGTLTSVKPRSEAPAVYSLSQNYPNPFNPSTVIRFGLASRSMVRLTVYNTLGQKVKELVDSELGAGFHEVIWRADVPSGVYFYRIEAISIDNRGKGFVETRKMALIR